MRTAKFLGLLMLPFLLCPSTVVTDQERRSSTPEPFILKGAGMVYDGEVRSSARVIVTQAPEATSVVLSTQGAAYSMRLSMPALGADISMSGELHHPPLIPLGFWPGGESAGAEGGLVAESLNAAAGAEHIYMGTVRPGDGYVFDSDSTYPLTFKVVAGEGYSRLCGRGTVTTPDGATYRLGYGDTADTWLPLLNSGEQLEREGASQAIGWLTAPGAGIDRTLAALAEALGDDAMEVRRDVAESLGRLGDIRSRNALERALAQEEDDWVRAVLEEALEKLTSVR